ncbi:circadian clock-controlled protein daywake-like [Euwallacea fornicatus]|uniref:circadian clock-controlled protein daywake-like n=1 Tax=Euwallacea fornicatus TaxID=995702 RepID=UPI00338D8571
MSCSVVLLDMTAVNVMFLLQIVLLISVTTAEIPSYIKVCRRNDPNLAQCIINSIEYLRPKLKEGIPELNVPSIEPLPLNEIKLRSGPNQARINANITNLLVHGPSDFKIIDLKTDLQKTRFVAQFTIPNLHFEGDYDIDMNILFLKYQGKGPIRGNFTNYVFNCIFKGDKIQRDNDTYIQFRKFSLKLFTGKSYLYLGNLFGNNGAVLSEATNAFIRENTDLFIEEIKPVLEDSLSNKFTNIANSITTKFSYDDLFLQ